MGLVIGTNGSATGTATMQVNYTFSGFLSPINNLPTINAGKAGRTYPVKWQLRDAGGALVSTLAAVSDIKYKKVTCGSFSGDPSDAIETTATGGTVLRNDGMQYIYNWDTPTVAGCYELYVILADASIRQANFNLSGSWSLSEGSGRSSRSLSARGRDLVSRACARTSARRPAR